MYIYNCIYICMSAWKYAKWSHWAASCILSGLPDAAARSQPHTNWTSHCKGSKLEKLGWYCAKTIEICRHCWSLHAADVADVALVADPPRRDMRRFIYFYRPAPESLGLEESTCYHHILIFLSRGWVSKGTPSSIQGFFLRIPFFQRIFSRRTPQVIQWTFFKVKMWIWVLVRKPTDGVKMAGRPVNFENPMMQSSYSFEALHHPHVLEKHPKKMLLMVQKSCTRLIWCISQFL